jgi:hypothetical protein
MQREKKMNSRLLSSVFTVVLVAGAAFGQMHGGSGGTNGMGGGTPSTGGMQGSSEQGLGSMSSGGPMMTQAERRQMLHTTPKQDQRYQACAHAIGRVHGDLHRMQQHVNANSSSGPSSDAQQPADDSSDDLSSDIQDLAQNDDDLIASLNDDQQAVLTSHIRDLEKKTQEMRSLAQQLKSELDSPKSDPKVLREHVKKLDKLTKETTKRQHDVAVALGIQG